MEQYKKELDQMIKACEMIGAIGTYKKLGVYNGWEVRLSIYKDEEKLIEPVIKQVVKKHPKPKKQKELSNTIQATLDLAQRGFSLNEIASERKLSAYTVSKHLAELILQGIVDVFDFVDQQTYNQINDVIQTMHGRVTPTMIKHKCPEGISRNVIRLVMAYKKRKQQVEKGVLEYDVELEE